MKSVRIRSYSVPHFSAFGLDTEIRSISSYSVQMRENADQNNSEYRHFLCNSPGLSVVSIRKQNHITQAVTYNVLALES